jgi:HSP20 family protein
MYSKALTKAENQVATVFDDFLRPFNEWFNNGGPLMRTLSVPSVNISEDSDQYKVALAAPGLKKSDFNIKVDGNMITISSEKEEKKEEKEVKFTRHEYSYSSFSRTFTLPDEVNQDKIEAVYADGVLTLTLPKREEAKKHVATKMVTVK